MRAAAALALMLAGCSSRGPFSAADEARTRSAARAALLVEDLCAEGASCDPARVRAAERMGFCASASTLAEHDAGVPESTIHCAPR